MKNYQVGAVGVVIVIIIALLAVGGGAYYVGTKTAKAPAEAPMLMADDDALVSVRPPVNSDAKCPEDKNKKAWIVINEPAENLANDLAFIVVQLPITVKGFIPSCSSWRVNEGEAGTIQVFDANDKAVSNKEIVRVSSDWMKRPALFEVVVGDREMMSHLATDTGYVLLTSRSDMDGEVSQTFKLPVRFQGVAPVLKTYSNTQYGFSLKYDANFGLVAAGKENGQVAAFLNQVQVAAQVGEPNSIRVFVDSAQGASSFAEYQAKHLIIDGPPISFKARTIGANTFYYARTERFEGTLSFDYYFLRGNKLYRFASLAHGVDWTNPNLDEENESTHLALRQMLATLEFKQ